MTGDVAGLLANLTSAAKYDVFNFGSIHLWIALQQRIDAVGYQIIGSRQVESPAMCFGKTRAYVIDDDDLTHDFPFVLREPLMLHHCGI